MVFEILTANLELFSHYKQSDAFMVHLSLEFVNRQFETRSPFLKLWNNLMDIAYLKH